MTDGFLRESLCITDSNYLELLNSKLHYSHNYIYQELKIIRIFKL